MLYFDRIDVSEGIGVNKTSASNECDICHYCYFLNKGLEFQTNVYNRCHDLLMTSIEEVPIIAVLLAELAKVRP